MPSGRPDCWQHITDSNTACDSREEVNAKIVAVGKYTIVPDKTLHAAARIIAMCPGVPFSTGYLCGMINF